VLPSPSDKKAVINFFVIKKRVGGMGIKYMVGVEEGREFRFRGDLYSQESTFPLVSSGTRTLSLMIKVNRHRSKS